MARKTDIPKTDIPTRAIDAALKLAAEKGWNAVSYGEIAKAADLSIAQLYPIFPSKTAILTAFSRQVDEAVLAGIMPEDEAESRRDRLFDVLMRRFELLKPHREAIAAIAKDLPRDWVAAACLANQTVTSMNWMLRAAGIEDSGMRGMVRARALAGVYAATLRVWLNDEGEDMGKTMAALDRNLDRAQRWAGTLNL